MMLEFYEAVYLQAGEHLAEIMGRRIINLEAAVNAKRALAVAQIDYWKALADVQNAVC